MSSRAPRVLTPPRGVHAYTPKLRAAAGRSPLLCVVCHGVPALTAAGRWLKARALLLVHSNLCSALKFVRPETVSDTAQHERVRKRLPLSCAPILAQV